MNILMTSAGSGRRVRLIRAFIKNLQKIDPAGKIVIVDENPYTPGLYISKKSYLVPKVTALSFNSRILDICCKEKIDWIIPTTDADLYHFAKNKECYKKAEVNLLVSDLKSIGVCNHKRKLYEYFFKTDIRLPKSHFTLEELNNNSLIYPMIIKPLNGFGSRDTYVLKNQKELNFFYSYIEDSFIQEYITGAEYTIDVLLSLEGKPVSVVPRERKSTRAGVSDVGITIRDRKLIDFGLAIVKNLTFIGPINIQCILQDDGDITLIEINPRFSGGISLTIDAGADFTLWILKMFKGQNIGNHVGEFTHSMAMMVYENACNRLRDDILQDL